MADLNYNKSKLTILNDDEEPEKVELHIDPLADVNLFSSDGKPEPRQEIQPEQKKKKVFTDEHKEKLKIARLKGLETRRRNRELKQQQRLEQEKNKINVNQKYEVKETEVIPEPEVIEQKKEIPVNHPVNNTNYENLQQVKHIISTPTQRHVMEKEQYNNKKVDPDAEFKKFYNMMNRYESIKTAKLNKRKKEILLQQKQQQNKLKKQKEENDKLIKSQQNKRNNYNFGFNSFSNRISQKSFIKKKQHRPNEDDHDYSQYF
jgi:hypothetical protein